MAKPLNCFIATIQTPHGVEYKIVDEKTFTVGRSLEATLSFADPNISRVHIVVYLKHDRVWIEDQKSANGTYVNGEKIIPEKMIPVEPMDVVKLGSSQIQICFNVIEKCFRKDELKNPILPKEDRESLMALIQGAHAEAQRLVKFAQEYHDKLIKNAETKAHTIETEMLAKKEETLSHAETQSQRMLRQAEEQARVNYAKLTDELTDQAHAEKAKLVKDLEDNARRRLAEATADAELKVSSARSVADETLKNAKEEAERLVMKATSDVAEIRATTAAEIENLKQDSILRNQKFEFEFQEKVQKETEEKAGALLKHIEEQALVEKEKILAEGREEIRHERESLHLELLGAKEELAVLKNEVVEQQKLIKQRREVSEQELQFRKEQVEAEMVKFQEEKKKEIQVLSEQRSREAEMERLRKLEEVEIQIQSQKLQFEKSKVDFERQIENLSVQRNDLEKHNSSLLTQKKDLSSEFSDMRNKFEALKSELSQNSQILEKTKNQHILMQKELSDYNNSKSLRHGEIKNLENRQAQMSIEIEALIEKTQMVKKDYEAQTAAYKTKLTNEYEKFRREQESQLDQLKLVEISEVKKIRDRMIEDLFKEKDSIAKNILLSLEKKMSGKVDPQFWTMEYNNLNQTVLTCLEEKTTTLSTDSQSLDAKKTDLHKKQKREKFNWMSLGAMASLAFYFVGLSAYEQFQKYQDPMKSAAHEEALARAQDLERRKFNPPQDSELRETYADSVIYTSDFVAHYLDEKFQEKWLKSATNYLLKQWRIEEERTIQILSAVNTMVKALDEKKQAIHPDFIPEGLKKMAELETESSNKIKEMLGSEVKYQAFRRFEKKFYLGYTFERKPAASDTESKDTVSVPTPESESKKEVSPDEGVSSLGSPSESSTEP